MAAPAKAWRVLAAVHAELKRQKAVGLIDEISSPDSFGRVNISGRVDLAALADATEDAIRAQFGAK